MPPISKTMGPIHFEDLDPHRFEDLVRELIYDWKEWQNIEATGRAGSDDGFDVRAWEKTKEITNKDEDDDDSVGTHPMDGNLWMIQSKREKELGPSAIKNIIKDAVAGKSPPYGYILAASVNFSKKSYDTFREELRKKRVMEFHLWGRAELEDMLHQPKNDHTLFTFFGFSLVAKKRSRRTEVKFAVNNKNKLLRVLADGNNEADLLTPVLLRNFSDEHYPWSAEYKDFDKNPRWEEYNVKNFHPLGIMVDLSKRFAYVDREKKEWDFTDFVDQISRSKNRDRSKYQDEYFKNHLKVADFWKYLPRKSQATLHSQGLVLFEDMLVIDDKGDVLFDFPHIFVDFQYHGKPFRGAWHYLEFNNGERIELTNDKQFKRIKIFPKNFSEAKKENVYKDKTIKLDDETWRLFRNGSRAIELNLFDSDGKFKFLKPGDVIGVSGVDLKDEPNFLRITHKYTTTVKDYMKAREPYVEARIESQIGRKVRASEKLNVYEFELTYHFQTK